MDFHDIRGVVMDMDGVLWRGDQQLPGVEAFCQFLTQRGIPFVLASNNSSRSPADYVTKLAKMGVEGIVEQQIVTSGTTTVDYLLTHYAPGTAVHVLGGDGLKRIISAAGFTLRDHDVQVVVVGIDFDLTYEKLKRAALLIRAGADFIGTNDDVTFPAPEGLVPGAGSLIAALKTATDRQPLIMGKPGAPMFEASLRVMGTQPAQTLMIGDRLNTDIAGAQAVGLKTALVLTGVTAPGDLEHSATQPDTVYEDLPALTRAWLG